MFYTSYYAKMRSFPKDTRFIAISRGIPNWYNGKVAKVFAPLYADLKKLRDTGNEEEYIEVYKTNVLSKLDKKDFVSTVGKLVGDYKWLDNIEESPIVFLCYEKSDSFCHRHIFAEWVRSLGFSIEEWDK